LYLACFIVLAEEGELEGEEDERVSAFDVFPRLDFKYEER
jgi:hypothetical protein